MSVNPSSQQISSYQPISPSQAQPRSSVGGGSQRAMVISQLPSSIPPNSNIRHETCISISKLSTTIHHPKNAEISGLTKPQIELLKNNAEKQQTKLEISRRKLLSNSNNVSHQITNIMKDNAQLGKDIGTLSEILLSDKNKVEDLDNSISIKQHEIGSSGFIKRWAANRSIKKMTIQRDKICAAMESTKIQITKLKQKTVINCNNIKQLQTPITKMAAALAKDVTKAQAQINYQTLSLAESNNIKNAISLRMGIHKNHDNSYELDGGQIETRDKNIGSSEVCVVKNFFN